MARLMDHLFQVTLL